MEHGCAQCRAPPDLVLFASVLDHQGTQKTNRYQEGKSESDEHEIEGAIRPTPLRLELSISSPGLGVLCHLA